MTRTQKLARLRVQAFSDVFKLFVRYIGTQIQQLRATAPPLALNLAVLVVVVTVFQMPLRIAGPTCHGSNRQHSPNLRLFEIGMQAFGCTGAF
jgi:hypothetical protein